LTRMTGCVERASPTRSACLAVAHSRRFAGPGRQATAQTRSRRKFQWRCAVGGRLVDDVACRVVENCFCPAVCGGGLRGAAGLQHALLLLHTSLTCRRPRWPRQPTPTRSWTTTSTGRQVAFRDPQGEGDCPAGRQRGRRRPLEQAFDIEQLVTKARTSTSRRRGCAPACRGWRALELNRARPSTRGGN
jgi:hypothetical protein